MKTSRYFDSTRLRRAPFSVGVKGRLHPFGEAVLVFKNFIVVRTFDPHKKVIFKRKFVNHSMWTWNGTLIGRFITGRRNKGRLFIENPSVTCRRGEIVYYEDASVTPRFSYGRQLPYYVRDDADHELWFRHKRFYDHIMR